MRRDERERGRKDEEEEEAATAKAAGTEYLRASPKQMIHFSILALIPICGALIVPGLFIEHCSPILQVQAQVEDKSFGATSGRCLRSQKLLG